MNQRIKKQWIAALRSGKYAQVHGQLKLQRGRQYGYCCLGVLHDLRCKAEGFKFTCGVNGVLPESTAYWAGLEMCDPVIAPTAQTWRSASEVNDHGESFEKIADLIEANL